MEERERACLRFLGFEFVVHVVFHERGDHFVANTEQVVGNVTKDAQPKAKAVEPPLRRDRRS